MSDLLPVTFDAPLVNPSPNGLFGVTQWTDVGEGEALRWLPSGVEVRVFNFGGADSFGIWDAAWDAKLSDLSGGDVKAGDRPDGLDTFIAMTAYAYDEGSPIQRADIRSRAQQVHRLQEPNAAEEYFAERLDDDSPSPQAVADIVGAVSHLEGELAKTNTLGFIHAGAHLAAYASAAHLIVRSGSVLKTPLGHTWVFGGGYVDELDEVLIATSQPFGWRGPVMVRDALNTQAHNRCVAIAERSLVIGYEAVIAAAEIDT